MGFPNINGKTRVCGLFGFPVEHSFSPAMHNAAYRKLGLNWVFADWFKRKGHFLSAYLWLLGITFLPLPVLIIYFLVRPKNVQTVPSPAKQCPFCGLKLEVESEVCPQCHNYLGEKLKIQR